MFSCQAVNCDSTVVGNSKHCEYHSKLFKPSYLKYKRLHLHVKELLQVPLNTYDVYTLLKLSSLLQELYDLRSNYRRIAFKPEYHDVGHNRILHEVLHKLDEVRNQLSIMFSQVQVNEVIDKEEETEDTPINIVSNIRKVVVTKHKEEWDKQSQIDYEYNVQKEARFNFLVSSSIAILEKMNVTNSKRALDMLIILFSIPSYLKHVNKEEKILDVLFRSNIDAYITKTQSLYDLHVNVYRFLVTKEPKCLISELTSLPEHKLHVIGVCEFMGAKLISLNCGRKDRYFPKFKLVGDSWERTNKQDTAYVIRIHDLFDKLTSSMDGLSTQEQLKRIRHMKAHTYNC